jgi:hypothetical protein
VTLISGLKTNRKAIFLAKNKSPVSSSEIIPAHHGREKPLNNRKPLIFSDRGLFSFQEVAMGTKTCVWLSNFIDGKN